MLLCEGLVLKETNEQVDRAQENKIVSEFTRNLIQHFSSSQVISLSKFFFIPPLLSILRASLLPSILPSLPPSFLPSLLPCLPPSLLPSLPPSLPPTNFFLFSCISITCLRDGFEVISKDEKAAVTLFSNQPEDLSLWYHSVKNNIIISTRQTVCHS